MAPPGHKDYRFSIGNASVNRVVQLLQCFIADFSLWRADDTTQRVRTTTQQGGNVARVFFTQHGAFDIDSPSARRRKLPMTHELYFSKQLSYRCFFGTSAARRSSISEWRQSRHFRVAARRRTLTILSAVAHDRRPNICNSSGNVTPTNNEVGMTPAAGIPVHNAGNPLPSGKIAV